MNLQTKFKKLLSRVVPFPVFIGESTTIDDVDRKYTIKPNIDTLIFKDIVPFFSLKPDLGYFEIRRQVKNHRGQLCFIIYHIETDQEFIMPVHWFKFFFQTKKKKRFNFFRKS